MEGKTHRLSAWNRAAPEAVADWLCEGWEGKGPLDLGDLLVLGQTKGAGRRLKLALARRAAERGQGMLPPRFVTPAFLFRAIPGEVPVASDLACLLHWSEVLAGIDIDDYLALFPKAPDNPDAAWGRAVGKALHGLRKSLSEGDFDCGAVASGGLARQWGEDDRWQDLARLERRYRESLSAVGLRDPLDANREAANSPELPPEVKRVLLPGVPGFPELGRIALEKVVAMGVPVEVLSFGPEGEAPEDLFDEWGRPLRSAWEKRPGPVTDDRLHLLRDERAQAKAVMQVLTLYGNELGGQVSLGVVDAEAKPYLQRAAEESELPFALSDPEGDSATGSPFYALLAALAGLVGDSAFRQAVIVLRFPDTRNWLERAGVGMDARELLSGLDELGSKRIPVTLADAVNLARDELREVLRRLSELAEKLKGPSFAETLRDFLLGATAGREFSEDNPADASYVSLSKPFMEGLEELESLGERTGEETFPLLLELLRGERISRDAEPNSLPMQGWLELPWEDAPRLILVGFNEGCVPEAVPGDTFLPENLRRELGLWTSDVRFARDAYLLQWLVASREGGGRVDFMLGKWRSGGDPLKPSRLLFLCDETDENALPARVQKLFAEPANEEENPAWRFSWRLDPGPVVRPEKISVTAFSSFLDCPYRFHLKRFLEMDSLDPLKSEGDSMDFGSLVHNALEVFGRDEEVRQSDDADLIRSFLKDALDKVFAKSYGANPGLPLLQQKESAWLRLSQAADEQAKERRAGWIPVRAEDLFRKELDGIFVGGKVDRVDMHETDGSIRVLDYKTSSNPPAETHWGSPGREPEQFPEYARFMGVNKSGKDLEKRWIGLQLPLYRWWAEDEADLGLADKEVAVGYFNLSSEAVGVTVWEELDDELMASAMACAKGVIADLQSGLSCSPRRRVTYDDFKDLFFHDSTLATIPLGEKEGEGAA